MNPDERDAVATRFSVSVDQVVRDHLISHLLAVIADRLGERVQFIGGTALARTHLPHGRLSEDIDLIAVTDRRSISAELDSAIPRALARSHGRLSVHPPFSATRDADPVIVRSAAGVAVKVQLLESLGRTRWPTERRNIVQRYSDAPPAALIVPTLPAFAAGKTATWHDRRASRDLWDLWALNNIGAIDTAAAVLYRRLGPTGELPDHSTFSRPPTETDWQAQLSGQTRLTITAQTAITEVATAWAALGAPVDD